ncbi:MAG: toll/interleukin-1 receptor domain-containing protein [Acidobacteriota bacterium]
MSSPPAIFLSHNSEDKPIVREISAALKKRKLQPWFDEEDLTPGRPWQDLAQEAIQTCQSAAVFIDKSGMGPWEREEERALLTQAVRRGIAVIPVLLPGAPRKPDLPLFLGERTWVDLRTVSFAEGVDRLVWGIRGRKPRTKRAVEPEPSGPPPLHNLPFSPLGDLFKGRDDELRDLAASLQGDGKARAIVQDHRALAGLERAKASCVEDPLPGG